MTNEIIVKNKIFSKMIKTRDSGEDGWLLFVSTLVQRTTEFVSGSLIFKYLIFIMIEGEK